MIFFLLLLHLLFSFGTAFACFCRLHHCTSDVKWEVRASLAAMFATALGMAMGPFAGLVVVTPMILVFEGCITAYFIAGSQAWIYGIPGGLSKPNPYDRRRKDRRHVA